VKGRRISPSKGMPIPWDRMVKIIGEEISFRGVQKLGVGLGITRSELVNKIKE